jgi:hypothetical protein
MEECGFRMVNKVFLLLINLSRFLSVNMTVCSQLALDLNSEIQQAEEILPLK